MSSEIRRSSFFVWTLSLYVLVAILAECYLVTPPAQAATNARPKLILTIVIDQFRADYLMRFEKRFLPARKGSTVGGFNYLMSEGAYYPYGEFEILQSMTGPGHATILTGAYPYQMGIPQNEWFDSEKKRAVYCVEDLDSKTVGADVEGPRGKLSPKNLVSTTLGDELKNAGYPTKVVSLAFKDRGAILLGGHRADLAFWFEGKSSKWVSSSYYLPEGKLPQWLDKLNEEVAAKIRVSGGKVVWPEPKEPGTGFSPPDLTPAPDGTHFMGKLGRGFPHTAMYGSREIYFTPAGIELTVSAAEAAFDAHGLGTGKSTDILAVSFSSHDYVAHLWGPNSREIEEMTVIEDRAISKLLNHVRAKLPGGLKDVVVVLTGDHGGGSTPEWLKNHKVPAGRIDQEALVKALNEALSRRFGGEGWIAGHTEFNFYLNRELLKKKGVSLKDAEEEAKTVLLKNPDTAAVVTSTGRESGSVPSGMIGAQALHTYYPGRSGDLILVPKPNYILDNDANANHVTGYAFDRMVPIILAGSPFKPGKYAERARVVDIAPSLAFVSGCLPPSLSEGRVLSEAIRR